jgi:hypothetical protein
MSVSLGIPVALNLCRLEIRPTRGWLPASLAGSADQYRQVRQEATSVTWVSGGVGEAAIEVQDNGMGLR